jgi:uncharacterized protein (DUF1697 family)
MFTSTSTHGVGHTSLPKEARTHRGMVARPRQRHGRSAATAACVFEIGDAIRAVGAFQPPGLTGPVIVWHHLVVRAVVESRRDRRIDFGTRVRLAAPLRSFDHTRWRRMIRFALSSLSRSPWWDRGVARFVAFLRAVNLGERRVAMATARGVLEELGFDQVGTYANSGNLLFSAAGSVSDHEAAIRPALEDVFGFELTTFVRSARQVKALATDKPFGVISAGHTHFALLPLTPLTATEKNAVEALSNDHDEVVVRGRDVHWLIRSRSPETTLGSRQWSQALPDNPTTARNTTMLEKLAKKL